MQILKDDIKDRILTAAADEFYAKGYEKASIRQITKAANVSLSNIYNYFENKEHLFHEIVRPVYDNVRILLSQSISRRIPGAGSLSFVEFVRQMTSLISGASVGYRRLIIILAEKSGGSPFENAREEIIGLLERHFVDEFGVNDPDSPKPSDKTFIFHVFASNFISGYLQIIKAFVDDALFDEHLILFMKYHLSGLRSLKE